MVAALGCTLATVSAARGSLLDLTGGPGSSGVINGAYFEFGNASGGSGVISPFVRMQAAGIEHGYNTSNPILPFDEKAGSWTHDLRLNEIPIVNLNGVDYFEFLLDINETSTDGHQYLSLDSIQIYTSSVGSQNTTNVSSLGTLRYDLDLGEDNRIHLDSNHDVVAFNGTDMSAYIPINLFIGVESTDFVYFYSLFGAQGTHGGQAWGSSNGYEQWSVQVDANSVFIPAPGVLVMLAFGAMAGAPRRRRA